MMSGIGITFYFGIGDGFDAPPSPRVRTPSPPPELYRPASRRRSPPPCDDLSRSPDDSGGRWKLDGREYRRDAEGRVWVKKLPAGSPAQPRPDSPQWKTPPSPGKPSAPPAGKAQPIAGAQADNRPEAEPKPTEEAQPKP